MIGWAPVQSHLDKAQGNSADQCWHRDMQLGATRRSAAVLRLKPLILLLVSGFSTCAAALSANAACINLKQSSSFSLGGLS